LSKKPDLDWTTVDKELTIGQAANAGRDREREREKERERERKREIERERERERKRERERRETDSPKSNNCRERNQFDCSRSRVASLILPLCKYIDSKHFIF
jgi:Ni/Co efflux regulator RcnB